MVGGALLLDVVGRVRDLDVGRALRCLAAHSRGRRLHVAGRRQVAPGQTPARQVGKVW